MLRLPERLFNHKEWKISVKWHILATLSFFAYLALSFYRKDFMADREKLVNTIFIIKY